MRKIFLIGMPGSGKTTLGKQLAEHLQLPFVDLDDEIVKHEQESIRDIFSSKGEDYFRDIESRLLRRYSSSDTSFVMATGGGAPCHYDGISVINRSGTSVFLDVPIETLIARLQMDSGRPMLSGHQSAEALYQKLQSILSNRFACYAQAHITVTGSTVNAILGELKM